MHTKYTLLFLSDLIYYKKVWLLYFAESSSRCCIKIKPSTLKTLL